MTGPMLPMTCPGGRTPAMLLDFIQRHRSAWVKWCSFVAVWNAANAWWAWISGRPWWAMFSLGATALAVWSVRVWLAD